MTVIRFNLQSIANIPNVHQQLEKMKITLQRTCPCTKKLDTKRVAKTLPNTQAKWYADTKTRTFNDNCFALSSLFHILYSRWTDFHFCKFFLIFSDIFL